MPSWGPVSQHFSQGEAGLHDGQGAAGRQAGPTLADADARWAPGPPGPPGAALGRGIATRK